MTASAAKRARGGVQSSRPFHGTLVINPLQPGNELAFNYQKPYGMIQFDLYKGLSYKTYWSYYGYNSRAPANSSLLAPVGGEDFNGSTAMFAIRYAF